MGQWWFFMGFMGFFLILWDLPNLVVTARLLLEMAIEIVEFPIRMVMFHSYVTNYQRVPDGILNFQRFFFPTWKPAS